MRSLVHDAFLIQVVLQVSRGMPQIFSPELGGHTHVIEQNVLLPNISISTDDAFLCTSAKVPAKASSFVVRVDPHTLQNVTHHLAIYRCIAPGATSPVWDCGYAHNRRQTDMTHAPFCAEGFGKAIHTTNAYEPDLSFSFPPGVGFEVGGETGFQFFVLSAHFPRLSELPPGGWTGSPGFGLTLLQPEATDRKIINAGFFTGIAQGFVEPHSVATVTGSYLIHENVSLHPVGLAMHTHAKAIRVSVWKRDAAQHTHIIHEQDPQHDQGYHSIPVSDLITLTTGDSIEFSCTYINSAPVGLDVYKSEMCVLEMIYYDEVGRQLDLERFITTDPRYVKLLRKMFPEMTDIA